jgi:hypothetical protein
MSICKYLRKLDVNKNIAKVVLLSFAASTLLGCATAGKDIVPTYVSPLQFSSLDCDQLKMEMVRLGGRVNQLTGRLDEAAGNDKAILVGGGLLFFPALFALGGMKQQETELGRLKGEAEALQSATVQKKCV